MRDWAPAARSDPARNCLRADSQPTQAHLNTVRTRYIIIQYSKR